MSALKFNDPWTTWITSDTHAFHKNICKGCTNWKDGADRDYDDPVLMTVEMADIINKRVMPHHNLIHLGDWSFGGFDKIKKFRDMINCENIYLVLGNHDENIANDRDGCRKLFREVYGWHGVYCQIEIKVGQHKYFCGHFKPAVWNNSHHNIPGLWGHSHGSYPDNLKELSFDVGWDCFQRPLNFNEVEQEIAKREWTPVDHHDKETN
mgnify:CR=1 FL=1